MSNIMNDLHTVGLNPFGAVLLAESMLKSPLAQMTIGKPQRFFMPISRSDCAGWAGVQFSLEAVPQGGQATAAAPPLHPAVKMISEDEIEIHGVRYAVGAFEHLGLGPIGATLRIIKREDGVVTLERLP